MIYELKNFSLDNTELLLQETLFHNANGYIGVRSNFEEGYKNGFDSIRGSYINGFYDIADMKQAEKLYGLVEEKQTILNVADSQSIELTVGDEVFSLFEGTVLESSRYLDTRRGYTGRKIVWRSPNGKELELDIRRMTSFVQLTLFTIEYSVKSINFEGDIIIRSRHIGDVMNYFNPNDPRVAGESFRHLVPKGAFIKDGASFLLTNTSRSSLTVCTGVRNIFSKECDDEIHLEGHSAAHTYRFAIGAGETVKLEKYTVFCDSRRFNECDQAAVMEMRKALSRSLEYLYTAQEDYLTSYWEQASLEIEGDSELIDAVNYNLYQLIQSVGKDEYSNIAAKGLSGEGYEGHYFWDTEMYIQPFFLLTKPEIVKSLIGYRYQILDAARENAKIFGHKKGALYAWRTIMGKECSGYYPSGGAQYHINGDIAYSIVAYYLATKDMDLIVEQGAEIIFETARLWMDVGCYHKDKFCINGVTGPDEYTCLVNNNYFTNVNAQYNLRWAVKLYRIMDEKNLLTRVAQKIGLCKEEIDAFDKAQRNMYLPYDSALGINPQDDSFLTKPVWDIKNTPEDKFPLLLHYHPLHLYRYQVCKQADTVLSHFIFEDAQSLDTISNSFLYYEKVTTHDSSLSTCIFSIVASKLGLHDKAYAYFGDSAKLDLFNTHHNTKDGIHTANMGGSYMSIVYGFGGVRIKETGLYISPVLPEKWSGYRFKLRYGNSNIKISVTRDGVTVTLLHGEVPDIHVYGKKYTLQDSITVLPEPE